MRAAGAGWYRARQMSIAAPPRPRLMPQAGPAAWHAADLTPSDWMLPVGTEHQAELEAALAALDGRTPASASDAPMERLGDVLREAARRLDAGRGFALLRGLSPAGAEEAGAEAVVELLGVHLGQAVPQAGGARVGRVHHPVTGVPRWRFHADAADAVLLLTLRQPPAGEPAMLVAAAAVHNELLRRDRAALELLHRPMPHLGPDGTGVVDLPVFSTASGAFIGRYARDAIEGAQRLPEVPRLSAAQVSALDAVDAICAEPGLALRMELRPGDVLLLNPLQVWKRQAEVEGGAGAVREALRMLLVTPSSRALPEGLVALSTGGMVGG